MNAPSIDIKDMLEAFGDSSGFGLVFGVNLHIGSEPVNPREVVTIFDYAGAPPYLALSGETGYEYPSIQIRVRDSDYQLGFKLINDIKDSLHGRSQETWNGTLYSSIRCTGSPAFLERDSLNNSIFVVSFDLQRRAA
jgi:hypothetical protein